jgi:phosphatidylserine/phosphatidylglycerophosphate/cardiolipin synthase-like enzyme
MRLLVQPDDGVGLLVKGIVRATRSIEIVIFRFDQKEIERALANAVTRGVSVHALIAYTNRTGEENLRKLEMRLLAAGVTVARTADDLERYHGKLMLVDRRELYLLAFNWTYKDIEHSRSFGVVTRRPALVQEAERLFTADVRRHPYEPGRGNLVVSPVNARRLLSDFLKGAKKSLIIYDPKVSDPAMIGLLEERRRAGVDVKILGRMTRRIPGVVVRKLVPTRLHARTLHTRTMVRDGNLAFVGSQSLRPVELDARREIGVIFRDPKVVARLAQVFTKDWALAEQAVKQAEDETPAIKVARRVAKLVANDLPRVAPALNGAVKEIVGNTIGVELNPEEVEAAVKDVVKEAVKEVVSDLVQDVVDKDKETGQ